MKIGFHFECQYCRQIVRVPYGNIAKIECQCCGAEYSLSIIQTIDEDFNNSVWLNLEESPKRVLSLKSAVRLLKEQG
jgi:hypothetical protein